GACPAAASVSYGSSARPVGYASRREVATHRRANHRTRSGTHPRDGLWARDELGNTRRAAIDRRLGFPNRGVGDRWAGGLNRRWEGVIGGPSKCPRSIPTYGEEPKSAVAPTSSTMKR